MKQIKAENVLACEYISVGANGKPILLHTYVGDILVPEYPARFPLAFYIELAPDPALPRNIKFQVLQGSKLRAEYEVEFEGEMKKVGLMAIPPVMFTFDKDTNVRVIATCEGYKDSVILRKKVTTTDVTLS